MIKRLLPRTLLGRSLLIIVTPLILLQLVALYVFYARHWDVVARRLAGGVAGEVAVVTEMLRRLPPGEADNWLLAETGQRLNLLLRLDRGARLPMQTAAGSDFWTISDELLADALSERLGRPFVTDWQSDERNVLVQVQLADAVLHVGVPRKRLTTGTVGLFVLWLIGTALLLFGVATVFMRNQIKPIRRLAAAAEAFGKGLDVAPLTPQGASEVRQAAAAFNVMRARILRFLIQRTEMLAGVSHDLRTPLTRLRLALAMLPGRGPVEPQEVAEMTADLQEMERMIEGYLAFARGEGTEAPIPHDLAALLTDIVGRARRDGAQVALVTPGVVEMPMRVDAMRRCLSNLLDNALRHGGRQVEVTLRHAPGRTATVAEITIDDDGPGIPAERRDEAFKPFTRLGPALLAGRGEAGPGADGIGLGLTIARDIARAHGGDVTLEDSPIGGLRARLRLPI